LDFEVSKVEGLLRNEPSTFDSFESYSRSPSTVFGVVRHLMDHPAARSAQPDNGAIAGLIQ